MVNDQPKHYTNLPPDPQEPKALLRILFPYEEEEKKELETLLKDLDLTNIQACRFINDVYWAVENKHGKYRELHEFNYYANEVFNRFKRNLGKEDIMAEKKSEKGYNESANPIVGFMKKWNPHND